MVFKLYILDLYIVFAVHEQLDLTVVKLNFIDVWFYQWNNVYLKTLTFKERSKYVVHINLKIFVWSLSHSLLVFGN